VRAKKSENFTSYGFSFDLHHSLMEGEQNTTTLSGAPSAGGIGWARAAKAAAKEAKAAKLAAASAAAKAKREAAAQRARADGAYFSEDDSDRLMLLAREEGAGAGDAASAVAMADGPEQAPRKVLLRGRVDWRKVVKVVGSRRASVGDFGEARAAARGASPPPSLLRFGEASAAARGASAVDGGRVLLRSDALPAKKRGRSGSEDCGALVDTVHCELLDYFLTTALQENLALGKDDIVDLALGYLKMAVPRPIPPVRVAEHVRDVFPQLLKFATQRASGRPLAAGEAFDPSVHAWDAAATYEDWKRAYEEVYSKLPPDSILPLSILREREAADAARECAEAEHLAASKRADPKLACYNIGERAPCPHGCGGHCGLGTGLRGGCAAPPHPRAAHYGPRARRVPAAAQVRRFARG